MSTPADSIEKYATVLGEGFPEGNVWRHARVLREEDRDLWPKGGKGGGKSAAHVEVHHLVNLALSLAGAAPIDGVRALEALHPLRYAAREVVYRHPTQQPDAPTKLTGQVQDRRSSHEGTLGKTLTQAIAESADPRWRRAWAIQRNGMEFLLCPLPAWAQISWPTSDGIWTDHFLPPDRDLPFTFATLPKPKRSGRRVTILPYDLIVAAGELWEDTLSRRGGTPALAPASHLPTPPASQAEGQKDENAGHLCHKVPASSTKQRRANGAELSDHPRANGSGGLKGLPEGICEKKDFQGCAQAAAVTPS